MQTNTKIHNTDQKETNVGRIQGKNIVDGRMCNQPPLNLPAVHDVEGRLNDLPTVDRSGRAIQVCDIAIDPGTLDWLNLCAFDPRSKPNEEYAGFKESELPILNTRPLATHNPSYALGLTNYGTAGLGIKQERIDYSRSVNGRLLAVGPDRLLTSQENHHYLSRVKLDEQGMPIVVPRDQAKEILSYPARKAEYVKPLVTIEKRAAALAITPDRIVISRPAGQGKPAGPHLWLLDGEGSLLANADLPADRWNTVWPSPAAPSSSPPSMAGCTASPPPPDTLLPYSSHFGFAPEVIKAQVRERLAGHPLHEPTEETGTCRPILQSTTLTRKKVTP